ncbi:hypothetical protein SQ57_24665 [Klebsiella pneumoniae]|uniref:hypothetical protein n=1 Tax=Klebsiella pneumoniae TaxID=573 RepID=UPI000788EAB2|nr:hypothetical protein [Klebsiella pneumoniae]KYL73752.1 hypothetical protein SQ57_24665 [Klebsiella pneumoniae]MDP0741057.1 hypothetical protein [Klebsiella pneumoniae]VGD69019.1 Uncharacterised protein [Klebsiella pneumoniae]HBR7897719.1 hypothetical protein [Klebsiella pneumoniae]HBT7786053.1 hypothetical protein [Klebsiella pneumoniae]
MAHKILKQYLSPMAKVTGDFLHSEFDLSGDEDPLGCDVLPYDSAVCIGLIEGIRVYISGVIINQFGV